MYEADAFMKNLGYFEWAFITLFIQRSKKALGERVSVEIEDINEDNLNTTDAS